VVEDAIAAAAAREAARAEAEAVESKGRRRGRRRRERRRAAAAAAAAAPPEITPVEAAPPPEVPSSRAADAGEPTDGAAEVAKPEPARGRRRGRRRERGVATEGEDAVGSAPPAADTPVPVAAVSAVLAPAVEPEKPRRRRRRARRRQPPEQQLDLGLETATPRPPRARRWSRRGAQAEPAEQPIDAPRDDEPDVVTVGAAHGAQQLTLVDTRSALTQPSTISNADLVNEAVAGLFSRPTRTMLTVLGTMIGLTALVATLGLSRTAGNQIVGRFDEIAATEVDVTSRPIDLTDRPNELPWDAAARLEPLNGVVAAGSMAKVDIGDSFVETVPLNDPAHPSDFKLAVQAVSPSLFRAVRAKLEAGRFFDEGHARRADRVAVIGKTAAKQLGIDSLEPLPAIRIGDDPFLVVGIVDDVARVDKLMSSVMIPEGTARSLYHLRVPDTVVIETEIGANGLIAAQAPIALRPDNPKGLKVTAQPELTQVRESVSGDLNLLFLMLGGVSLLVGAIGIANVTLVSVMERTGEIGLRRALGATRRHVAQQFLVESTAMGLVGGILGASLGILIVVLVSAFQGWTPVVDTYIPFVAPLIGGLIGLVAGSYPARRAASMEPVEALRAGT
jgi:ABC-type antimicrobial peptide transport system permease subunit